MNSQRFPPPPPSHHRQGYRGGGFRGPRPPHNGQAFGPGFRHPPPPLPHMQRCPWQMQNNQMPRFPPNHFQRGPRPHGFFEPDIFGSGPAGSPHESFPFHQGSTGNGRLRGGLNNQGQRGGFRGRGRGFAGGRGGMQGQHQGKQQKNAKKAKVDKRDLPENNAYFCDICDRGFKTEDKYKEHIDGHTKCSYKDCSYIAAPKLVKLHVMTQHSTGLAKRVWNLESDEDINKWREERKRNFPTPATIARKKELMKEKEARGELIHTKDFSKMRGRGRDRHRGRGRRGRGGRGRWRDYDSAAGSEMKGTTESKEDEEDEGPEEVKICKSTAQDERENEVKLEITKQGAEVSNHGPSRATNNEENNGDASSATSKVKEENYADQYNETTALPANSLSLLSGYGESSSDDDASDSEEIKATVHRPSTQANSSDNALQELTDDETDDFKSDPLCAILTSTRQQSHPTSATSSSSPFMDRSTSQLTKLSPSKKSNIHANSTKAYNTNSPSPTKQKPNISTIHESKPIHGQHSYENCETGSPSMNGQSVDDFHESGSSKKGSPPSKKRKSEQHQGDKEERKRFKPPPKRQPRRNYTLLEKLLAPDIRRERNKILQCVHYVVKHKFFMDTKTPGT